MTAGLDSGTRRSKPAPRDRVTANTYVHVSIVTESEYERDVEFHALAWRTLPAAWTRADLIRVGADVAAVLRRRVARDGFALAGVKWREGKLSFNVYFEDADYPYAEVYILGVPWSAMATMCAFVSVESDEWIDVTPAASSACGPAIVGSRRANFLAALHRDQGPSAPTWADTCGQALDADREAVEGFEDRAVRAIKAKRRQPEKSESRVRPPGCRLLERGTR